MQALTLDEELAHAKRVLDVRRRELSTAQSYVDQAERRVAVLEARWAKDFLNSKSQ